MFRRVGTGVGLVGMSLCMSGLMIDVLSRLGGDWQVRMNSAACALQIHELHGVGDDILTPSAVLRQIALTMGAVFLFIAALSQGSRGRLFQILEGALVIYGALSLLPLPQLLTTICRVGVSVGMFATLWRLGLLKGRIAKVGAIGLEALGLGYLFGSHWFFMIGGILLTVYCGYWLIREKTVLNVTWTVLNGPFAAASAVVLVFQNWPQLGFDGRVMLAALTIVGGGIVLPLFIIRGARKPASRVAVQGTK